MSFQKNGYVYILTNKRKTVLYTGVTNNLIRRIQEHRSSLKTNSFTAKYNVSLLIYYEAYANLPMAIFREKQIKNLLRIKKIELINKFNPGWDDLTDKLIE